MLLIFIATNYRVLMTVVFHLHNVFIFLHCHQPQDRIMMDLLLFLAFQQPPHEMKSLNSGGMKLRSALTMVCWMTKVVVILLEHLLRFSRQSLGLGLERAICKTLHVSLS